MAGGSVDRYEHLVGIWWHRSPFDRCVSFDLVVSRPYPEGILSHGSKSSCTRYPLWHVSSLVCVCVCVCVCVRSVVSDSATRWTVASRLQCLRNFAGKNAWVGCHFLLQRTDPGIKRMSPELAGKFFYLWAIWEALVFFITKKEKEKSDKMTQGHLMGRND